MIQALEHTTVESPQSRVVKRVRQLIDSGTLTSGLPLPSERAISKQLRVHRDTVRRAFAFLDQQGWIERGESRGWLVAHRQGKASDRGILNRAIVVLAPNANDSFPGHIHAGWAEFVSHGAVAAIRKTNRYALSINTSHFSSQELKDMIAQRPLGVVVADVTGDLNINMCIEMLHDAGVPLVVYGANPAFSACDRIASDHEQGAYELTKRMIAAGRQRIVNVWSNPADLYWLNSRRAGYERAMNEAGLKPLPTVQIAPTVELAGKDADQAHALFTACVRTTAGHLVETLTASPGPDAMLVTTDHDYFYVAAACRLFGRKPGQQILIAGYDNYHEDALERQFEPSSPAASVDKLNEQAGEAMVQLLLDRVEGRLPQQPQLRMLAPRVVEPPQTHSFQ